MSSELRELHIEASEIDAIYPKRVGAPDARIRWIAAAIKRDGVNAVRSGTEAFAKACEECGLNRRHDGWGGVPYPQKYYGKTYAYYLVPPDEQFCISSNRVVRTEHPGINRVEAEREAVERRELNEAFAWWRGLTEKVQRDWEHASGIDGDPLEIWHYMRVRIRDEA